MNPAHITHSHTGESAQAFIARMWAALEDGGDGKPPQCKLLSTEFTDGKKSAALTEETLWVNHPDATEELVIAEEDIPGDMEDEMPTWRVMDYFSLTPEVQFVPGVVANAVVTR